MELHHRTPKAGYLTRLFRLRPLVHLANCGRVTFIATPFRNYVRKVFWVDQAFKAGVEHLALAHGITRSVVVMTAFQHYLDRHGVLQERATLACMEGP